MIDQDEINILRRHKKGAMRLRIVLGSSQGYWEWEAVECEACLNEIEEGQEVAHCPHCGASFHVYCYNGLLNLKPVCPRCRRDLGGG